MSNSYYWTCPFCNANLDPGESCSDCNPKNKLLYPYIKGTQANNYQAVTPHNVNKLTIGGDVECHTDKKYTL